LPQVFVIVVVPFTTITPTSKKPPPPTCLDPAMSRFVSSTYHE
jgi:hypothetical protein